MKVTAEKKPRRRRIARRIAVIAAVLLALWFLLPTAVERWVLPQAASSLGFGYFTARVRHIGLGSMDISEVGIGSAPGSDQLNISSARVDFTPGFGGIVVDRVSLSGVELDVTMDEAGNIRIASKTLDELRKQFAANPKSGGSAIRVRSLKIDHGEITFSTPNSRWRLPVELEIVLPEDDGCVMSGKFRIAQARDHASGSFSYCDKDKDGRVEFSTELTLQRYLPLFAVTRSLPFSGRLAGKINCEFNLGDHSGSGLLSLRGDGLSYNNIAIDMEHDLKITCLQGRITAEASDGSTLALSSPLFSAAISGLRITADAKLPIQAEMQADADCELLSAVRFKFLPSAKLNAGSGGVGFSASGDLLPLDKDGSPLPGSFNLGFSSASAPQPHFELEVAPAAAGARLEYFGGGADAALENPRLEMSGTKYNDRWRMRAAFSATDAAATLPGGVSGAAAKLRGSWECNGENRNNLLSIDTGRLTANAYGHRAAAAGFAAAFSAPAGSAKLFALGDFSVTGLKTDLGLPEVKTASLLLDFAPPETGAPTLRPWKIECADGFAAAGTSSATSTGWTFDGSAWKDAPGGADPHLTVTLDRIPSFQVLCRMELPDMQLNAALLRRYFPKIKDWEIGGTLRGSAEYRYGLGNNRGFANVSLANGSVKNAKAGIELRNIACSLSLPNLPQLSTVGPQRITCEKIVYSGINMDNFRARFQLLDDEVLVDEAGVNVFGGEVALYALRLRRNAGSVATTMFCNGIKLADFINAFGFAHAHGSGRLFGRVPVYWRQNHLFVRDGFLFSEPGVPESLRIADLKTGMDLAQAGAELDVAQEAMRDFVYNWVKISMDSEGETLNLKATLSGAPSGNLPFTFDPGSGGFRRVDYRGAHFQGIELVLNWSIPLNKLLELNELYGSLTKGIEK